MSPDFQQMAEWSGGVWHRLPGGPCTGFSIDSRNLNPGNVFVALPGKQGRDGHDWLGHAQAAGASAAVVTRQIDNCTLPQLVVDNAQLALQRMAQQWRALFPGPVIAITGSCGKTSTKDLLALLLSTSRNGFATPGNLNNELGVPLSLLQLDPDLHQWAVIEAGINQPGEMERLGSMIQADAVILTMVGSAHLELLGSHANIAHEKTALIRKAKSSVRWYCPADCLQYPALADLPGKGCFTLYSGETIPTNYKQNQGGRCVRVTTSRNTASASADRISGGIELTLESDHWQPTSFQLPPIMSAGMVSNTALAIAVALNAGLEAGQIQQGLNRWQAPARRGELSVWAGRSYYLDCYNSNPSSLADSVANFCQLFPSAPRTFVIGGMRELGANSAPLHQRAGAGLPLLEGDFLIAVGSEAEPLITGALASHPHLGSRCHHVAQTASAHNLLSQTAGPVFIKGSRTYALETLLPCSAN